MLFKKGNSVTNTTSTTTHSAVAQPPTSAFVGASWLALLVGGIGYNIGLWNSTMPLASKGFYFVLLMYGLFSAVSVQKSVRDRSEGIRVTNLYYGLCWVSVLMCIVLLVGGLFNAETIALSEKGYYGMTFLMATFAGIAVQKNIRDLEAFKER